MRPTTVPSSTTSKSSAFHSPDGREAEARFRRCAISITCRATSPGGSRVASLKEFEPDFENYTDDLIETPGCGRGGSAGGRGGLGYGGGFGPVLM